MVFTAGTAIASQAPNLTNPTPGVATIFAVTTGSLPSGLALDPSAGAITGTPTVPGVYTFTLTATNGTRTAVQTLTYTVTPAAALAIAYATPVVFTAGTAIASQAPNLTNPTPGVATTYAVTSGALPGTLALDPNTGAITGTPTVPGVYTFTLTATNGTRTAVQTLTYTVTPAAALAIAYPTPVVFTAGTAIASQAPNLTNPTPAWRPPMR